MEALPFKKSLQPLPPTQTSLDKSPSGALDSRELGSSKASQYFSLNVVVQQSIAQQPF